MKSHAGTFLALFLVVLSAAYGAEVGSERKDASCEPRPK